MARASGLVSPSLYNSTPVAAPANVEPAGVCSDRFTPSPALSTPRSYQSTSPSKVPATTAPNPPACIVAITGLACTGMLFGSLSRSTPRPNSPCSVNAEAEVLLYTVI